MSRKAIRRRGGPALIVAISLLLASGALRLATGAGPAIARAETGIEAPETADQQCDALPTNDLLEALNAREERIAAGERALSDRMQALQVAEERLQQRLDELVAAEQSLEATLAQAETANDSDIASLVTIYENMKPAEAAALFEQMSPEFSAGFLARMRPDAAAAVLAGLEPSTAYSISAVIAGRNANAPRE